MWPIFTNRTEPTDTGWKRKKENLRNDSIYAAGPGAFNEIKKGEEDTDPDTLEANQTVIEV